jgi:N-acylneuraminate cytidylyltransferase
MGKSMKIVCFICARGGSKGLKNKNIRSICGKPLIAWSIEQAMSVSLIDEVVISTDSSYIAEIAVKFGAKVYFMRPSYLALDESGKWEVWQDALMQYEKSTNQSVDIFLDLDCTSPLRLSDDIVNAINLYRSSSVDVVFSICEAKKNPYFNMVEYNDGCLELSKPLETKIVRRQDAPAVYEHAASIYVISPSFLNSGSGLLSGKAIGYEMPYERCIDIDSDFDYQLVELLMNSNEVKHV